MVAMPRVLMHFDHYDGLWWVGLTGCFYGCLLLLFILYKQRLLDKELDLWLTYAGDSDSLYRMSIDNEWLLKSR